MKRYLKVKYLVALILLVLLLFVLNKVIVDLIQRPVVMVEKNSIVQDGEIQKSNLTSDSIITWDNTNLKIYDFQGNLIEEIIGNGYYTNVYFFDDIIYVLDKQLNVLYIYNSKGQLDSKIELSGSVYSIFKKDGEIYVHRKDELNNQRLETISKLEGQKRESPVYETNRFIINFIIDGQSLYMSEITVENYAYKSVLSIINKGQKKIFDFGNETILDMKKAGKNLLIVTNKNLYLLEGQDRKKVELHDFRDYLFEGDKVLVLYGNKLVKFNEDLSINESFDIRISSTGLLSHDGGYFVYGPTDLIGYIGENREFTKTFDSIVTSVSSNDEDLLVTTKYGVNHYTFERVQDQEEN